MPKFYSTSEAAHAVGVSRQTLQTWLAEGKVKGPKIVGATRVWSESEVAELRRIDHKGKNQKRKSAKRAS